MFLSSQCLDSGHLGKALADRLQYGVVFDVVLVVGLDLSSDTVESSLQRILGRGVHHLGLWKTVLVGSGEVGVETVAYHDTGIIGRPCNEGDLVSEQRLALTS